MNIFFAPRWCPLSITINYNSRKPMLCLFDQHPKRYPVYASQWLSIHKFSGVVVKKCFQFNEYFFIFGR